MLRPKESSLRRHTPPTAMPKVLRQDDWLTPLSPCEHVPIGNNQARSRFRPFATSRDLRKRIPAIGTHAKCRARASKPNASEVDLFWNRNELAPPDGRRAALTFNGSRRWHATPLPTLVFKLGNANVCNLRRTVAQPGAERLFRSVRRGRSTRLLRRRRFRSMVPGVYGPEGGLITFSSS